jgi:hypothetical protein
MAAKADMSRPSRATRKRTLVSLSNIHHPATPAAPIRLPITLDFTAHHGCAPKASERPRKEVNQKDIRRAAIRAISR